MGQQPGSEYFFSPNSDGNCGGHASFLNNGYRGLGIQRGRTKPTTHYSLVSILRVCGAMPQHSHTPNSPSDADLSTADSSNLMTIYANNYPACLTRNIGIFVGCAARCVRQQNNTGIFNRLRAVYLSQKHLFSHSD
jgi:hypothetical protein